MTELSWGSPPKGLLIFGVMPTCRPRTSEAKFRQGRRTRGIRCRNCVAVAPCYRPTRKSTGCEPKVTLVDPSGAFILPSSRRGSFAEGGKRARSSSLHRNDSPHRIVPSTNSGSDARRCRSRLREFGNDDTMASAFSGPVAQRLEQGTHNGFWPKVGWPLKRGKPLQNKRFPPFDAFLSNPH